MESNIRKIEKDLSILSKKVSDIESEIDNLELKIAIIKEMQKDEKLKASAEVENELEKVVNRLHALILTTGLYEKSDK